MNCGDCLFAMPCYSDRLSKTTAQGYGAIKLCTQCGHTTITERNGKTTRFECELRVVTPLLRKLHLNRGGSYHYGYAPAEPAPVTTEDPGPAGGHIELIVCSICHLANSKVRLTATHTGNTDQIITIEVSDSDGTNANGDDFTP